MDLFFSLTSRFILRGDFKKRKNINNVFIWRTSVIVDSSLVN